MTTEKTAITGLLLAWSEGDSGALDRLMPVVYEELKAIAERHLARERANHTLQPTALVHEAYLKLVDQTQAQWKNRSQFFGVASQLMRRILVDHARARASAKRGGGEAPLPIEFADDVGTGPRTDEELLTLDSALDRLTGIDPRQGRIVELRYFGGLSIEETGDVIGVSPATVKREWTMAKAWLRRELSAA